MGKGTEPGKCLACLGKVFLRQKIFYRNEQEMKLEKKSDGWILKRTLNVMPRDLDFVLRGVSC